MSKNDSTQLRWVILLLVTAVVLPTVCLLWFMLQAVRNERLAVHQKLVEVYQKRLDLTSSRLDELWGKVADEVKQSKTRNFQEFLESHLQKQSADFSTCVIYDLSGKPLDFPANVASETPSKVLAARILRQYPSRESLGSWPADTLRKLDWPLPFYALRVDAEDLTVLMALNWDQLAGHLREAMEPREDFLSVRVHDNFGDVVFEPEPVQDEPFVKVAWAGTMPGWKAELYLQGGNPLETAAKQQTALYLWAGILVIAMIVMTGAVSVRAITRQAKLNRLKNDFIATVTHELKTPLSSMRVLVDTLREGRSAGPTQMQEYLELISRENDRLSRLIDNFLTFSRMERNKRSFAMERINPAILARQAAEAVHAKYHQDDCMLNLELPETLPPVLADPDALITVLVNLLDNARKYNLSPEKRVSLKLSSETPWVSFIVEDNGIGMSRRTMKRIFDRFYQADTSLSRKTEGCGLGLSIVKYIVDAHQGRIEVKSQPGKGSTFTVKLRAGNGGKTVISW